MTQEFGNKINKIGWLLSWFGNGRNVIEEVKVGWPERGCGRIGAL